MGLAFLGWEAWWIYVYISTPRPDPQMTSFGAELLALWIPGTIVLMFAGVAIIRKLMFVR
jgi:hypothetical protein